MDDDYGDDDDHDYDNWDDYWDDNWDDDAGGDSGDDADGGSGDDSGGGSGDDARGGSDDDSGDDSSNATDDGGRRLAARLREREHLLRAAGREEEAAEAVVDANGVPRWLRDKALSHRRTRRLAATRRASAAADAAEGAGRAAATRGGSRERPAAREKTTATPSPQRRARDHGDRDASFDPSSDVRRRRLKSSSLEFHVLGMEGLNATYEVRARLTMSNCERRWGRPACLPS